LRQRVIFEARLAKIVVGVLKFVGFAADVLCEQFPHVGSSHNESFAMFLKEEARAAFPFACVKRFREGLKVAVGGAKRKPPHVDITRV
jgi:hypothetical protein